MDRGGSIRAYLDLTRAHFAFVWPVLALSGLAVASTRYDGLTWTLAGKVALAGLLGFEAGLVLNDYVDRRMDAREVDASLTRYWRPFGTRPLPSGQLPQGHALAILVLLALCTAALIATFPFPHSLYVGAIMVSSYGVEYFYQVKKGRQRFPVAQLLGRTDLALFPVAGYLALGQPDGMALLLFLFLYPWAEAHLGVNDLADLENDRAKGLKTIPVLYDIEGNVAWIALFSLAHGGTALLLLGHLGSIARAGFLPGFFLLAVANLHMVWKRTPDSARRALPLFHGSLIIYAGTMILDAVF